MIQEFIKKHGITKCPPVGSKELATVSIEREKAAMKRGARNWGFAPTLQPYRGRQT